MAPIYWIIAVVIAGILFWYASKGNRKLAKSKRRVLVTMDLARENQRLRHVLAHTSVENYALKYPPPDNW